MSNRTSIINTSNSKTITSSLIVSPFDPREYKVVNLSNGLVALLITEKPKQHDVDSTGISLSKNIIPSPIKNSNDQPAVVSLSVHVGGWSDPLSVEGLAHFLEHMLFMGTSAYPDENEWEMYLSQHGGGSNAFTELEDTVYHYYINPQYLAPSLTRFSHFFIDPLFAYNTTSREMQAVHSEFRDAYSSDETRINEMLCEVSSKDHPLQKFTYGNIFSLGGDISIATQKQQQKDSKTHSTKGSSKKGIIKSQMSHTMTQLRTFFDSYYSSHAMKLVIYSTQSIETLETYLKPFESIPNRSTNTPQFSLSDKERLLILPKNLIRITPLTQVLALNMYWTLPPSFHDYNHKSINYIEHILGFEGKGSLYSFLRRKGWSTSLTAGNGDNGIQQNSSFFLFSIHIQLTPAGVKEYELVLKYVFAYISMVQRSNIESHIWDELASLAKLSFLYEESPEREELVEDLAVQLQHYPPHHVIYARYAYEQFKPEMIKYLLDMINDQNVHIQLISPTFSNSHTNKARYFDTPYSSHPLPLSIRPPYDIDMNQFSLPQPNPYIPTEFGIKWKEEETEGNINKVNSTVLSIKEKERNEMIENIESKNLTPVEGVIIDQYKENLQGNDEQEKKKKKKMNSKHKEAVNSQSSLPIQSPTNSPIQLDHKKERITTISNNQGVSYSINSPEHNDDVDVCYENDDNDENDTCLTNRLFNEDPCLITLTDRFELWHKIDKIFNLPRANVFLLFSTPLCASSPFSSVCADLCLRLFSDHLIEETYPASLAELTFSTSILRQGLEMKVSGYSHRLTDFVIFLITHLASFSETLTLPSLSHRYLILHDKLSRHFQQLYTQPIKQAAYMRLLYLQQRKFSIEEMMKALTEIKLENIIQFAKELIKSCKVRGIVHGNLNQLESHQLGEKIISLLHLSIPIFKSSIEYSYPLPLDRTLKIPSSTTLLLISGARKLVESNHAIELHIQIGPAKNGSLLYACCLLLEHISGDLFFDELRTKQQCGYRVGCSMRNTHNILGFTFSIQSPKFSPPQLHQKINQFFLFLYEFILSMNDIVYQHHINALYTSLLYIDENLMEMTEELWEEMREPTPTKYATFINKNKTCKESNQNFSSDLSNGNSNNVIDPPVYLWNRRQIDANSIKKVSKLDLLELIEIYILGWKKQPLSFSKIRVEQKTLINQMKEEKNDEESFTGRTVRFILPSEQINNGKPATGAGYVSTSPSPTSILRSASHINNPNSNLNIPQPSALDLNAHGAAAPDLVGGRGSSIVNVAESVVTPIDKELRKQLKKARLAAAKAELVALKAEEDRIKEEEKPLIITSKQREYINQQNTSYRSTLAVYVYGHNKQKLKQTGNQINQQKERSSNKSISGPGKKESLHSSNNIDASESHHEDPDIDVHEEEDDDDDDDGDDSDDDSDDDDDDDNADDNKDSSVESALPYDCIDDHMWLDEEEWREILSREEFEFQKSNKTPNQNQKSKKDKNLRESNKNKNPSLTNYPIPSSDHKYKLKDFPYLDDRVELNFDVYEGCDVRTLPLHSFNPRYHKPNSKVVNTSSKDSKDGLNTKEGGERIVYIKTFFELYAAKLNSTLFPHIYPA